MDLELRHAFGLFVGMAVLLLAATLLLTSRRRAHTLMLVAFLVAVGINFVTGPLRDVVDGWPLREAAYIALAVDPLFLLAFVHMYPFRRENRATLPLYVTAGLLAAAAAGAAAIGLHTSVQTPFDEGRLDHLLAVATLVVGYTAAWFVAVEKAVRAPTPELARRASWLVVAVGVATVPRLALLPVDLGWTPIERNRIAEDGLATALAIIGGDIGVYVLLMVLLLVATLPLLRRADGARAAGRAVAAVALLSAGFALARFGAGLAASLDLTYSAYWLPFGLRWLVFGGILTYGVLAYDVVDFARKGPTVFALLGGALAGVFASLLALAANVDVVPALTLGLAASAPAGLLSRGALRAVEARTQRPSGLGRRLELYRAALEEAYAGGPPGAEARSRLDRERRDFGVTHEEARALEHVVAARLVPARAPAAPGEEVGPGIVIEAAIGEGAQAQVYRARRHPEGDVVVAKVLKATGNDDATRRRLLDEVRPLTRLAHPNIVRLLDVHADHGRYVLVMEHVEGRTLDAVLVEERLGRRQLARLAAGLVSAVSAAHRTGVLHRDIKPQNVLIDAQGNPHLLDFGVAVLAGPARARTTGTVRDLREVGGPVGSLAYMAPEQAREERVDATTDIYQVGLVLYEAVTGHRALDVRGLRLVDALDAVAEPEVDLEALPTSWRPVLATALHRDPRRRFASADAMLDALRDAGLT